MSRYTSSWVLVLCLVCLGVASSADARIGNPLKKAKEKLQKAVDPTAQNESDQGGHEVVFDNVTVELTNERVEHVMAALEKSKEERDALKVLSQRYDALQQERTEFNGKHSEEMSKLRDKRSEVEGCYHDAYQKIQERKARDLAEHPMDPERLAKFSKAAQADNAKAAAGDTAAQARINATLLSEYLPSREDSAGVRKSCGPVPPKSAAETRLEAYDKQIADVFEDIRKQDDRIAKAQAKEGLLSNQQWATTMERIEMWVARNNKGGNEGKKGGNGEKGKGGGEDEEGGKTVCPPGYTKQECEVLSKHLQRLRPLVVGWR